MLLFSIGNPCSMTKKADKKLSALSFMPIPLSTVVSGIGIIVCLMLPHGSSFCFS